MKYTVAVAALVALVTAQSTSDIPSCALPCLDDAATAAGCEKSDVTCLCKNYQNIQGNAATCVIEECGQEKALREVAPAAVALCKDFGTGETPMQSKFPEQSMHTPNATMDGKPSKTSACVVNTMTAHPSIKPSGNNTQPQPQPTNMPITGGAGTVGVSLAMLALGALAL